MTLDELAPKPPNPPNPDDGVTAGTVVSAVVFTGLNLKFEVAAAALNLKELPAEAVVILLEEAPKGPDTARDGLAPNGPDTEGTDVNAAGLAPNGPVTANGVDEAAPPPNLKEVEVAAAGVDESVDFTLPKANPPDTVLLIGAGVSLGASVSPDLLANPNDGLVTVLASTAEGLAAVKVEEPKLVVVFPKANPELEIVGGFSVVESSLVLTLFLWTRSSLSSSSLPPDASTGVASASEDLFDPKLNPPEEGLIFLEKSTALALLPKAREAGFDATASSEDLEEIIPNDDLDAGAVVVSASSLFLEENVKEGAGLAGAGGAARVLAGDEAALLLSASFPSSVFLENPKPENFLASPRTIGAAAGLVALVLNPNEGFGGIEGAAVFLSLSLSSASLT